MVTIYKNILLKITLIILMVITSSCINSSPESSQKNKSNVDIVKINNPNLEMASNLSAVDSSLDISLDPEFLSKKDVKHTIALKVVEEGKSQQIASLVVSNFVVNDAIHHLDFTMKPTGTEGILHIALTLDGIEQSQKVTITFKPNQEVLKRLIVNDVTNPSTIYIPNYKDATIILNLNKEIIDNLINKNLTFTANFDENNAPTITNIDKSNDSIAINLQLNNISANTYHLQVLVNGIKEEIKFTVSLISQQELFKKIVIADDTPIAIQIDPDYSSSSNITLNSFATLSLDQSIIKNLALTLSDITSNLTISYDQTYANKIQVTKNQFLSNMTSLNLTYSPNITAITLNLKFTIQINGTQYLQDKNIVALISSQRKLNFTNSNQKYTLQQKGSTTLEFSTDIPDEEFTAKLATVGMNIDKNTCTFNKNQHSCTINFTVTDDNYHQITASYGSLLTTFNAYVNCQKIVLSRYVSENGDISSVVADGQFPRFDQYQLVLFPGQPKTIKAYFCNHNDHDLTEIYATYSNFKCTTLETPEQITVNCVKDDGLNNKIKSLSINNEALNAEDSSKHYTDQIKDGAEYAPFSILLNDDISLTDNDTNINIMPGRLDHGGDIDPHINQLNFYSTMHLINGNKDPYVEFLDSNGVPQTHIVATSNQITLRAVIHNADLLPSANLNNSQVDFSLFDRFTGQNLIKSVLVKPGVTLTNMIKHEKTITNYLVLKRPELLLQKKEIVVRLKVNGSSIDNNNFTVIMKP
jgi:hypothetical protein